MANYTVEINDAYADIKDAGLAVTLRTLVAQASPADVAEPWKGNALTSGSAKDQTSFGLFVALKKSEIDGTRVQVADRAMLLPGRDDSGAAMPVTTDMQIIANSITYSVVEVLQIVAFNEQEILHRVALRA